MRRSSFDLTPEPTPSDEFRAVLLREAQVPAAELESVARAFEQAAAAHLKLCDRHLTRGLTSTERQEREAIENWFALQVSQHPGIASVRFLHDPRGVDRGGVRGSSVSLRLESGAANSLTGNWKVPVLAEDYKQLGHDFARQYIEACKQDDHKVAGFEHAGFAP
ncbi:hypothetical protein [Geopseudomonas aromaticivorans]